MVAGWGGEILREETKKSKGKALGICCFAVKLRKVAATPHHR
jgi:hypothetical protein